MSGKKQKKKFCLFISSKFVKIVGSTYKHRTLPLSLFCTDEEYKFKRKNLLSRPQRILAKSWFKTQKTYKKTFIYGETHIFLALHSKCYYTLRNVTTTKKLFFHIHKPTTLFSSETEKKSAKILQNPQLR